MTGIVLEVTSEKCAHICAHVLMPENRNLVTAILCGCSLYSASVTKATHVSKNILINLTARLKAGFFRLAAHLRPPDAPRRQSSRGRLTERAESGSWRISSSIAGYFVVTSALLLAVYL